ncbi:MAG: MCP four helix bundle domain-containing protein [Cyclobacteriaceae bacterium]
MKWSLSTAQKIRAGIALAIVFLLIIATNQIDSNHFSIVKKTLTTVYEDRILVKNYIYNISRLLDKKQKALRSQSYSQLDSLNTASNDSIRSLINKFSKTYLTEQEAVHFQSLENSLNSLFNHERQLNQEKIDNMLPTIDVIDNYYDRIHLDLDALSKIQIEESRRQIMQSNKSIDTSDLISRIEIGVLIFIGILLQLLIFLKPLKIR